MPWNAHIDSIVRAPGDPRRVVGYVTYSSDVEGVSPIQMQHPVASRGELDSVILASVQMFEASDALASDPPVGAFDRAAAEAANTPQPPATPAITIDDLMPLLSEGSRGRLATSGLITEIRLSVEAQSSTRIKNLLDLITAKPDPLDPKSTAILDSGDIPKLAAALAPLLSG